MTRNADASSSIEASLPETAPPAAPPVEDTAAAAKPKRRLSDAQINALQRGREARDANTQKRKAARAEEGVVQADLTRAKNDLEQQRKDALRALVDQAVQEKTHLAKVQKRARKVVLAPVQEESSSSEDESDSDSSDASTSSEEVAPPPKKKSVHHSSKKHRPSTPVAACLPRIRFL